MAEMKKMQANHNKLEKLIEIKEQETKDAITQLQKKIDPKFIKITSDLVSVQEEAHRLVENNKCENDEVIKKIEESSKSVITDFQATTQNLENAVKYRLNDCETLLKSRITEDYVKNLGVRIQNTINEKVSNFCHDRISIV